MAIKDILDDTLEGTWVGETYDRVTSAADVDGNGSVNLSDGVTYVDKNLEGTKWGETYDKFNAGYKAGAGIVSDVKNGQSLGTAMGNAKSTYSASLESDNNSSTNYKLTGSSDVSISDLTEGISHAGMEAYLEALRATVLTETINVIDQEAPALQNAINAGWQGEARDVFFAKFNQVRGDIASDLTDEYYDLVDRLHELEDNYFAQDQKMIDII